MTRSPPGKTEHFRHGGQFLPPPPFFLQVRQDLLCFLFICLEYNAGLPLIPGKLLFRLQNPVQISHFFINSFQHLDTSPLSTWSYFCFRIYSVVLHFVLSRGEGQLVRIMGQGQRWLLFLSHLLPSPPTPSPEPHAQQYLEGKC